MWCEGLIFEGPKKGLEGRVQISRYIVNKVGELDGKR